MTQNTPKKIGETRTTYPCGCVITTVASGTPLRGTITRPCEKHNPYKNLTPKVEQL